MSEVAIAAVVLEALVLVAPSLAPLAALVSAALALSKRKELSEKHERAWAATSAAMMYVSVRTGLSGLAYNVALLATMAQSPWLALFHPLVPSDMRFLHSTQLGICLVWLGFSTLDPDWAYAWAAACAAGRVGRVLAPELGLVLAVVAWFLASAKPPQITALPVAEELPKQEVKSILGYVRDKFKDVEVDDTYVEIDENDVTELVVQLGDERMRPWARQSLKVSKGKRQRALEICQNLMRFRRKWNWPLRLDARGLEPALRSGMHWILPGVDTLNRKVITFRASALSKGTAHDLQKMMLYLLERITLKNDASGVAFLVDLKGASLATLRHLAMDDLKRGMEMLVDAFPCRLRAVYVVHMPLALTPVAAVVKGFLSPKIRSRLHVTHGPARTFRRLLKDVPASMIPASHFGGSNTSFDWDHEVDAMLKQEMVLF